MAFPLFNVYHLWCVYLIKIPMSTNLLFIYLTVNMSYLTETHHYSVVQFALTCQYMFSVELSFLDANEAEAGR